MALRAISLNLFGHNADWPARLPALQEGLRRLRPDVLALQEAVVDGTGDQAAELLGREYHLAHQTRGLVGDGHHRGASVASHGPSWAWWAEAERELQALAVARRIEELVADDPAHVVAGGDFNAAPDAASIRFWTGRQTLDGVSTAYRDCWESVNVAWA